MRQKSGHPPIVNAAAAPKSFLTSSLLLLDSHPCQGFVPPPARSGIWSPPPVTSHQTTACSLLIHLRFTPSSNFLSSWSPFGGRPFSLLVLLDHFWSHMCHCLLDFLAIRDLGGHSYLLFAGPAIARPSTAPELGPSPFHCLFEHSLQPELVQNEWNATVIGGKGSSLWRGARI